MIALGVVVGVAVLCAVLCLLAGVIVVDDCGGVPPGCRNLKEPQPCPAVCEPLTLREAIFGE